jgi:hypothetical protein
LPIVAGLTGIASKQGKKNPEVALMALLHTGGLAAFVLSEWIVEQQHVQNQSQLSGDGIAPDPEAAEKTSV